MDKAHVQVHKAFLSIKQPYFLPLVFSLFLGKNFLIGSGRKHLDPTIYFPFSPLNQTHSKKVFLPIFSSKFSIYPISPLNKHTLNVIDQKQELSFKIFSQSFFKAFLLRICHIQSIMIDRVMNYHMGVVLDQTFFGLGASLGTCWRLGQIGIGQE